jgi:cysteinyl-tRNA synthetase
LLISKRNLAREQKDFKRSDEIRKMLNEGGVVIEDNQNVTTWKYK